MPDETLYSWLGRCAAGKGYPSIRNAMQILLGSENKQLSSLFCNVIPELSALTNMNHHVLIEDHTILPIFRSFITEGLYQTAQTAMLNGETSCLDKLLSTTANRMKLNPPLRYCPHCCALDETKFGFPYWRVEHQLPGVYLCTKHQQLLQEVGVARRGLVMPECIGTGSETISLELQKLAQFSLDARHQPLKCFDHHRYQNCIRERLRHKGYVTTSGRVRQSCWQQSFKKYWRETQSISEIGDLLNNEAGLYLQAFFCSEYKVFSPLKHFLLLTYLFGNWKAFTAFYAEYDSDIVVTQPVPKQACSVIVPQYLPEQHGSLRCFAKRHKCSITTAKKLALQQGVQIDRRPQILFGAERDLIRQLLEDGLSTAQIAGKMQCSVASVEQILAQNPGIVQQRKDSRVAETRRKHRDAIKTLITTQKFLRRTDVQKAARAAYTWLYKNDADWLYQQLPAETPREQRWLH
jgi:predicted transcriptional regulator